MALAGPESRGILDKTAGKSRLQSRVNGGFASPGLQGQSDGAISLARKKGDNRRNDRAEIGQRQICRIQPNERVSVTRNPDYWKHGYAYLDGVEYTILKESIDSGLGVRRREMRYDIGRQCDHSAEERYQEQNASTPT
jgi:hypothetical protein